MSAAMTLVVFAIARFAPRAYVGTAVGAAFLLGTWLLVWRRDDAAVTRSGLALGGLVIPGEIDARRAARSAGIALLGAALASALFFVPFAFGFRAWFHPRAAFSLAAALTKARDVAAGQLFLVALPEEAFYRGYLQSELDRAMPWRANVLGAKLGPAILVASAIFALGHVATIPVASRLAVFFPSLVFGWLRARTGGVGASTFFHAACNVFSEALRHGYGLGA